MVSWSRRSGVRVALAVVAVVAVVTTLGAAHLITREHPAQPIAGADRGAVAQARPTPVPMAAVPSGGYGFSTGASPIWLSPAEADRELDAVAATTGDWVRLLIDWERIEPVQGSFNWSYVDRWVDGATARGLRVLGLISYTAQWARPAGTTYTHPPTDDATFAAFATQVVQRYGDRVSDWEIWNEPNLPIFFGGLSGTGARYTSLLQATYPAIKAVQPNSTVIAGGLSRLPGFDAPPSYLQQMYAAGAQGFFDAAAAHPYVFPTGLAADPENGWSDVGRMYEVMTANGDGGKRIWLTELGAATSDPAAGGVSQEEQATQITEVMAAAALTGYSGPAFIYAIRDIDSSQRTSIEHNFGALLTSDWQPKVAAQVLSTLRRAPVRVRSGGSPPHRKN